MSNHEPAFWTSDPDPDEHPDEYAQNYIGVVERDMGGIIAWAVDRETADRIVAALSA